MIMYTYVKLLKLPWIRNLMLTNEQTYPTVQIVTDNTITHTYLETGQP